MQGPAAETAVIDLVDNERMSAFQLRVILLCAVIALLDGFDTQAIGFVAPVIAAQWQIPVANFGPVFAIGLVGGLIGAILFGAIADRIGRRTTLLATVALFAAGSLATMFATSMFELGLWRFITGLGLGGAMPSIIALASEYSPRRRRATLVVAMFCGFPLGAVAGALASAPLIEAYGWTSVFLLGGALPLLALPFLYLMLPESLGWLIARGGKDRAAKIVARMGKPPLPELAGSEAAAPRPTLSRLFTEGRALGSILLAIIFFISLLLVFLLVSWVPSIAVGAGLSARAGVIAAAVLNLSGVVGSLVIAAIADRRGAFGTVGTAYWLGGIGVGAVALAATGTDAIFPFVFVAGLFAVGAQVCAVSIASQFYPVELRGAGVGWAMAMGRFGAISGPLIGSAMIGGQGQALYWLVAGLSAGAGTLVLLMGTLYASRGARS